MERNKRNNMEGINTNIYETDQQFSIDIKKIGAVDKNKYQNGRF